MSCSNCYTGCTQIVSDKCVQYTGADVPGLGIKKGDSLSYVEQALTSFLTDVLDGSGIKIELNEEDYCELITQYLQSCSTVTAFDLFKALVKAACDLQTQIDEVVSDITSLEGNYTIECLEGVSFNSGTHSILQATINKLCSLEDSFEALALDLETNYVKTSELNDLIGEYIASTETATRYKSRMVPYGIQAYYGSLGVFDLTGKGLSNTEWEDIYLCNGLNSTPDLRGFTLVGAITGVPGGSLDSKVNPASTPFNPSYSLGTAYGDSNITLSVSQIPSHTHTLTDPEHSHALAVNTSSTSGTLTEGSYMAVQSEVGAENEYTLQNAASGSPEVGLTSSESTGISIASSGGGQAHSNIQPSKAVYYIMYIPS